LPLVRPQQEVNPIVEDGDRIVIDCYRVKVELTKDGEVRFYAYNARNKGDVLVLVKSDKILLTWEHGGNKTKEILKERMKQVVFSKVFNHEDDGRSIR